MNECKCPKDYTEILVTYVYFGVYMVSKGKVLVYYYSQIFFTITFFKFNFLIIWWHGVFVHSLCQTLGKVDMQFLCYTVMDIFKHHNFLTTTTLWQTDSADEKLMIFFSENRLWCFMQIVSLKEAVCMKYQSLTSGKNKKDYFKMFSAEFCTQHAKHLIVATIFKMCMDKWLLQSHGYSLLCHVQNDTFVSARSQRKRQNQ